jgi:putative glutamine amidotransferase
VQHHGLMTRPLIGITSEMAAAGWGDRVREAVVLPASYAWALQRAGCVPVLLPPAPYGAAGLAARLDAVVFSDGGDIDPRRWGGAPGEPGEQAAAPDPVRDAGEFALMRAAIEARLPLLAIGRGMLVLNAVRGGSAAERPSAAADPAAAGPAADAPAADPAAAGPAADAPVASGPGTNGSASPAGREIRISPGSRLGRVLGPSVSVPDPARPAGGHQAVNRLGGGLAAVAWAADDTVLAVELAGHPFALGLQWHPDQGEDLRIFEELRKAAADGHRAAA